MTPQDQPNPLKDLEDTLFEMFMEIQPKETKSQPLAGDYTTDALAAIKAYFLDLIGDDEPRIEDKPAKDYRAENSDRQARNNFRAELREKLK